MYKLSLYVWSLSKQSEMSRTKNLKHQLINLLFNKKWGKNVSYI